MRLFQNQPGFGKSSYQFVTIQRKTVPFSQFLPKQPASFLFPALLGPLGQKLWLNRSRKT
jgi:hypothetical protein